MHYQCATLSRGSKRITRASLAVSARHRKRERARIHPPIYHANTRVHAGFVARIIAYIRCPNTIDPTTNALRKKEKD